MTPAERAALRALAQRVVVWTCETEGHVEVCAAVPALLDALDAAEAALKLERQGRLVETEALRADHIAAEAARESAESAAKESRRAALEEAAMECDAAVAEQERERTTCRALGHNDQAAEHSERAYMARVLAAAIRRLAEEVDHG